ncbi:biotin--[acetyl-CoA-carboxylase] ligase [Achromobacter sp. F4_2707]|uniref:biotin--[acetyl-CoA-carboxylase] ligase n=1 Tax=Achromobacter sp. F4_2707 TaxID=3114286 RepID=UPI0039C6E4D4
MQNLLQQGLPEFHSIEWVGRTTSTNADLLQRARAEAGALARPWLLGAHLQESGRGRSGRSWQNRSGANLMFSCAFDIFLPPASLPTLSPFGGLIVAETLRSMLTAANRPLLTMKWPNDLQWRFAKLAGLLVEVTRAGTARQSADHHVAILGIGINLDDARALSTSLNRRIADWSEVSRADSAAARVRPEQIVMRIARAWYENFAALTSQGFEGLPERYAAVDGLLGQKIDILENDRIVRSGNAVGVNQAGQLLLRCPDGEHAISVGEVSARAV